MPVPVPLGWPGLSRPRGPLPGAPATAIRTTEGRASAATCSAGHVVARPALAAAPPDAAVPLLVEAPGVIPDAALFDFDELLLQATRASSMKHRQASPTRRCI
jgi:hypothetical protein